MASNYQTSIQYEDKPPGKCSQFDIKNTSTYSTDTGNELPHTKPYFNQYAVLTLTLPNGMTRTFTPENGKMWIPTASQTGGSDKLLTYKTCLAGIYKATYVQLPTPLEQDTGVDNSFYLDDCFYWKGKFYKVLALVDQIPGERPTTDETIAYLISQGELAEITADEISPQYKSEIEFINFCRDCYTSKLKKLNCLIVQDPSRTDICDMELYSQVNMLAFISFTIGQLPSSYVPDVVDRQNITDMLNYVNTICCCSKCKEVCKCKK